MKLGIIISQTEPETVFNALRLANYSLKQGDTVKIFLVGKGVELDKISDAEIQREGAGQSRAGRRRQVPRVRHVPQTARVGRLGDLPVVHAEGPLRNRPRFGPAGDVLIP